MYHRIFIATLVTVCLAHSPDSEPAAAAEVEQESRRVDYSHSRGHDHNEHQGPYITKDHDYSGPVILRTIRSYDGHAPDIAQQNKIIADVYNPDYYQPTWILDYRYMKTGGRDYIRGPGGQYIILPKNVRSNEHKEFPDYDAFLEHLRHKSMAEREQMRDERERDPLRNHHKHRAYDHKG